jgi:hypothetical protein
MRVPVVGTPAHSGQYENSKKKHQQQEGEWPFKGQMEVNPEQEIPHISVNYSWQ